MHFLKQFFYWFFFSQELIQNQLVNLERAKLKEEQNEEQFNQTLADKDSQILELQDKLDGLIQPRMNSARSREELEAIESQDGGLVVVTKQLKKIASTIMVSVKTWDPHWGKNQIFIQKLPKMWCFKNVNFAKNEIWKLWILSKMRL